MRVRRDLNGEAALRFPEPTNWRPLLVQLSSTPARSRIPTSGPVAPRRRGATPCCAMPSDVLGQRPRAARPGTGLRAEVLDTTGKALRQAEFSTVQQRVAILERPVSTASSDGGTPPTSTSSPVTTARPPCRPTLRIVQRRSRCSPAARSVAPITEADTVQPQSRTVPDPPWPDEVIDRPGRGVPEQDPPQPEGVEFPGGAQRVGIAGPAAGGSVALEPAPSDPAVPGGTKPVDTAGPRGSSQVQAFKPPKCLRKRFHCRSLRWYAKARGVLFREHSVSILLVASTNLISLSLVYKILLAYIEHSEFVRRHHWLGMLSARDLF